MFNGSKAHWFFVLGENQLLCLTILDNDGIPFGQGFGGLIEGHFSVDLQQAEDTKSKNVRERANLKD